MKLLLCLQLLLLLSSATSGNNNRFGTKVDARTLTKQQFDDVWAGGQNFPTVLTHVYGDLHLDDWCKSLIERCGNTDIEYDVRFSQTGQVESYVAPFADFVAALPEQSDHDESSYLMTEDLLQRDALRGLAAQLPHPEWLFGPDLFQHFPATVRPQQALIVGGCGARSFLHADPYEWVGTNLLLEGRKLWTFFSPDVPAELFHARRNAPDAWGSFNVSAGWVSHDVDLYRHRQSIPLGALVYYALKQARAGAGAGAAAEGRNEGLEQLMRTTLAGAWLEAALSAQAPATGAVGDVKRHLDMPLFLSGDDRVDRCADPRLQRGCVQIVQEPGDMILIPPNYWHQVHSSPRQYLRLLLTSSPLCPPLIHALCLRCITWSRAWPWPASTARPAESAGSFPTCCAGAPPARGQTAAAGRGSAITRCWRRSCVGLPPGTLTAATPATARGTRRRCSPCSGQHCGCSTAPTGAIDSCKSYWREKRTQTDGSIIIYLNPYMACHRPSGVVTFCSTRSSKASVPA